MRTAFVTLTLLSLVLVSACRRAGQSLETSIVEGDWPRIAAAGAGDGEMPAIVRAHAYIALNRNNEALCALATQTADDLRAWDEWTRAFVDRHPGSSVAHYLRGDAFARRNAWAESATALDEALEIDADNVLALNARGVVRSFRGDWNGATADFLRAGDLDARFVDALASRGSSQLQSRAAPEGALDAFESALKLKPDLAVAAAGRAYAQLALARWDDGNRALADAAKLLSCAPSLIGDGVTRLATWVDAQSGPSAIAGDLPPGTQLDTHLRKLVGGDVSALKPIARIVGENPELERKTAFTLQALKQQNPTLYNEAMSRVSSGQNWTRPNGGAETLLNGLKAIEVGGGVTMGKAPLTVKGEVAIKPSSAIDTQIRKTNTDHRGWTSLQRMGGGQPAAGGVTTSLASAHVDRGDWPFEPIYTLLYVEKGGNP